MSIAEKLTTIAENVNKVYEAGKAAGGGSGENPFYYASTVTGAFANGEFPENYNLVMKIKKLPSSCVRLCENAKNLKTFKIINEETNTNNCNMRNAFYEVSSLISVDFTQLNNVFSNVRSMFQGCINLVAVYGDLDFSNITDTNAAFYNNRALEDIRFVPYSIKVNLSFTASSTLSNASIQSIIDGLADLTDSDTQTLTFHATVGAKLTDTQKATITAKNWTLAY